jgi:LysR family transcriptional regulator, carnitine catabolism transcriptional activator
MNVTFRQLEILVAAAEAGSFSEAADRLSISQPAFSEAIRRIESEVGLRLFDRTTRSLTLTADGRRVVAVARDAVRSFKGALETLAARGGEPPARLSIAALPSVACAVLPFALRDFAAQYPGVRVTIHDVQHERAVALVTDGKADIAVTFRPMCIDNLVFEEIASDAMHLVCRKDHPLAKHKRVRWRDLGSHAFIGMTGISSVRRLTDAAFINNEAILAPRYEVEQIPSAIALVEAGLGVTALPALTFPMFRSAELVMRPLVAPQQRRRIGILRLGGRTPPGALQAVAMAVRTHLRRVLNV